MSAKVSISVPKLTVVKIRSALRTVHVKAHDGCWFVKQVANPRVWKFDTKSEALEKATDIAKRSSLNIVIHKDGKIVQRVPHSKVGNLIATKPTQLRRSTLRERIR